MLGVFLRGLSLVMRGLSRAVPGYGADAPSVRGAQVPGVVFLKYGGGIFENIPEKCSTVPILLCGGLGTTREKTKFSCNLYCINRHVSKVPNRRLSSLDTLPVKAIYTSLTWSTTAVAASLSFLAPCPARMAHVYKRRSRVIYSLDIVTKNYYRLP